MKPFIRKSIGVYYGKAFIGDKGLISQEACKHWGYQCYLPDPDYIYVYDHYEEVHQAFKEFILKEQL